MQPNSKYFFESVEKILGILLFYGIIIKCKKLCNYSEPYIMERVLNR